MNLNLSMLMLFSAFALVLTGCSDDPAVDIVAGDSSALEPSSTPHGCTPGKPTRIYQGRVLGMTEIESRCPDSKPLPIGASRKLVLGTVVAELPCKTWPDFAGSWWRVLKPYPKHLVHIGHAYLPGKMTLVSEGRALFTARAIELHVGRRDDPPIRFPAKGDLELNFERIEGPVPQGGCD